MALSRWLENILTHYKVPYQEHHHPPVFGASHLAQAEHVSGYRVAKTVFLSVQNHPVAVVLPATSRLDLGRLDDILGEGDHRLASEDEISHWFKGCEPGAVPPLRIRPDMQILMDRSLACFGNIIFPAGTQEEAVRVRFRDWYRAVRPGVGRFAQKTNGAHKEQPQGQILVIEDESETNQLLCQLLKSEGFSCQGVEGGKSALDQVSQGPISAILLDLMLPDMSGFEVYERIRQTGPMKRIPVIVVTALDDEKTRQRIWDLGADAYLTKPFMPQTLMSELREALAQ